MPPVYLVGAGGFALELLDWIYLDFPSFRFAACLITSGPAPSSLPLPCGDRLTVESFMLDYHYPESSRFLMGVSDPLAKSSLVSLLITGSSLRPISYVSRRAYVSPSASIGQGSVVCPGSSLSPCSSVGEYVTLNCNSLIGHHASVGNFCTFFGQNSLNGGACVGDMSILSSCSCVAPKISIGRRSKIGIGSVVVNNIPDEVVVFGNPAKRIF